LIADDDADVIWDENRIRLLQFVNEQTIKDVVTIDFKTIPFAALSHSCLQMQGTPLLHV
jgi:hypothetical protein